MLRLAPVQVSHLVKPAVLLGNRPLTDHNAKLLPVAVKIPAAVATAVAGRPFDDLLAIFDLTMLCSQWLSFLLMIIGTWIMICHLKISHLPHLRPL